MSDKRCCGAGDGGGALETLPDSIISEVLTRLDVETLCSVACTCRTLRSAVALAFCSFSSLDLSIFSPDTRTLNQIVCKFNALKSVTLDCLRLDDHSVVGFLGAHTLELNLLKCSSLSSRILSVIGQRCPNLRSLKLELISDDSSEIFKSCLVAMLKGCSYLESVCIKVRGAEFAASGFQSIEVFLPKRVQVLKLQPIIVQDAIRIVQIGENWNSIGAITSYSNLLYSRFPAINLRYLSLVLDVMSDELIILIVNSVPHLVELDLEDRPEKEPSVPRDLTNAGLQSLGSFQYLISLALVRSRQNYSVSFKRINDLGMFLLSECCTNLQSVKLGGFSTVTDAGFTAILSSSKNLKKFEVRNSLLLSDLAFHHITGSLCSLVELRLVSCNLLTSESAKGLATSNSLEVLDLCGCRSIADTCVNYISCLITLTTLNLSGGDVTDSGMALLGKGKSPISRLCLRGCKRVTDRGINLLLRSGGTISSTLSSIDLGSMPGVSDRAITTIDSVALQITELSIRYCFYVTDAAVRRLASNRRFEKGGKVLRQLDLFHCLGLSVNSFEMLKKPFFRGLRWLGAGLTRLANRRDTFSDICGERPWLTICLDGCEMGCHDGWQFHKLDGSET